MTMITLSQTRPRRIALPAWAANRDLIERLFVLLTLVGVVAGAALTRLQAPQGIVLATHLATYVFGGTFALVAVYQSLRRGLIEVDLLMVLAALGAAYIGA